MSWLDDLTRVTFPGGRRVIGASFRGVPFYVDSSDRTGGRRVVTHAFPGRDVPFIEELGRSTSSIRVDAFVFGDDVATQRSNLLAALEDVSGPGELVHPQYGRLQAVCAGLTIREATREGRVARFQIDFQIQHDEQTAPVETPDLEADVEAASSEAAVATETALTNTYDTSASPSYAVASLQAELINRTEGLRAALGRVVETTAELARLELETNSLVSQASTLIRSPADALDAFLTVLGSVSDTIASSPGRVVEALVETYGVPDQPPPVGSSAISATETANLAALTSALKQTLIVEASRILPSVAYETTDDARSGVATIVGLIDEQAETASDDVYAKLMDLRGAVSRAVPGDAVLARIIVVKRVLADPSLLVTYRLYGSVAREAQIIARNSAPDPGFIAGDIEALSR